MQHSDEEISECNHLWLPWEYLRHKEALDGKGGRVSESIFGRECIKCRTNQESEFPTNTNPNIDDDFG